MLNDAEERTVTSLEGGTCRFQALKRQANMEGYEKGSPVVLSVCMFFEVLDFVVWI